MRNKSFYFSTIFISFAILSITPHASAKKSCDNGKLFVIGLKSFCESENELSITCFGDLLFPIKKAYIQCATGYFSPQNITQQVIQCEDEGEWSELPMKCVPVCKGNPKTVELIVNEQEKYPTWYAEIVRKTPIPGKENIFPGIVLYEREILTRLKYFKNDNIHDFVIRLHNYKMTLKEYRVADLVDYRDAIGSNKTYQYDELCMLTLYIEDYFKFTEDLKPACIDLNILEFGENEFLHGNIYGNSQYKLLPTFYGGCVVPNVDSTKIEMQCFKNLPVFEEIECPRSADFIRTRCRIGYQSSKLTINDNLSRCSGNNWYHLAGEDNTCELICGEIDKEYRAPLSPLLYKGNKTDILTAPWHVGIYSNSSSSGTYQQICGGSIIHSNIVISAAHCFFDEAYGRLYDASNFLIGAGKRFRSYDISEKFDHYAGVKKIEIPINYQEQSQQNDIAIVVLDHHLKYTSHIKPICIDWEAYKNYNVKEGIEGRLVGWGSTSKEDVASTELLAINLATLTNEQCKKNVNPNFRSEITGDKFCAKNDNNAAACRGDSGGGFVIKKNIGTAVRYFLSGIVSLGVDTTKYCSDGFLTIFTNIQFYQDLIKSIIAESRDLDSV